jgi:hypothetical protein
VSRYMMHTEGRQSASHWASRVNNIIWSAKEKAESRHSTHRLQANTAHDSNNCSSVIYREIMDTVKRHGYQWNFLFFLAPDLYLSTSLANPWYL